jgi:two-component system response regulator
MNRKIILLVEDNADDVALTLDALAQAAIVSRTTVVNDGVMALDYLFRTGSYTGRREDEWPALVLLDLKLPKIDGLSVLRQLRADPRTKLLPVIVLTSSKEERDIVASYHLGANSYVRKPVDFDQFLEAVRLLGLYWLLLNEAPPQVNPGTR